MKRAVYPGSFDPVTNGHLDIIRRCAHLVDELVVGVLRNSQKQPLFSVQERVWLLEEATRDMENVRVQSFDGLVIQFARQCQAQLLVRGLRAITDFEYELQMAQTNRVLAPDIDTMFLATGLAYAYVSSSMVKEVASYGGDIRKFVPEVVADAVRERMSEAQTAKHEMIHRS